jgi:hypothetical protein
VNRDFLITLYKHGVINLIGTVRSKSCCVLIERVGGDVLGRLFQDPPVSIIAPLLLCMGRGSIFLGPLYAPLQTRYFSLAPTCAMIFMHSAA